MTWRSPGQSMQSRLLGPLIGLMVAFVSIFIYLAWIFYVEYRQIHKQIVLNSEVVHFAIEVTRARARTQELLVLYRLEKDPKYPIELASLDAMRSAHLAHIQWLASSNPTWRKLGLSLIGGLGEARFLQVEMARAIENREFDRADEAFRQLSTIFELNSARLKDFTLRLENDLHKNQQSLQRLLLEAFVILVTVLTLIAVAIWVITIFYRRNVLNPMQALHLGLQSLARGEMNVEVPLKPAPREILEMTADFNQMAKAMRATQVDLTHAREEALQSAQAKSDFLANMSHEIRTPMNTIIGMADVLSEASLPAEARQYVDVLRKSGQVLLNIVNDILDFSKLEAGGIVLENKPIDFRELVARVVQVVGVTAKRKGIFFTDRFEPGGACWVLGDAKRIEQIILNLLGNAVKFTEAGGVELLVSVTEENQNWRLSIRVRDSGIGISNGDLKKIFARFSQSDTSVTRKYGGTGLGLAIVKQLVDIMKGKISVTSEIGKGSQFLVELSLPKSAPEITEEPPLQLAEGPSLNEMPCRRVLLADDSPDNRFLIQTYLKDSGYEITVAKDGKEAVELHMQREFDLILMDMQMPILDGYTATAKIRDFEKAAGRAQTPIVALTAYALAEEIQRSLSAGCTVHLTKPVRKADLIKTMARVSREPEQTQRLG